MTSTFRKRLGPMSVVATIAVLGLLAAFISLGAMPGITFAQDDGGGNNTPPPPPPPPPDTSTGGGDTPPPPPPPPDTSTGGGDTPPPPPPPEPTVQQSVVGGAPSSYVVEGPSFVIQERQDTTRYTISVLDEDGNTADFSLRPGSEVVRVYFDVVNTAQGDVDEATSCLPMNTDAVALDRLNNQLDLCEFTMDVSEYPWFDIFATTVPHGTDVGISMVVDGNPVGDTHTVTFLNPGEPAAPPPLVVDPLTNRGDEYSVVSYNDWTYMDVTDGYIVTDLNGVSQLVNDHPHQILGWMDRDEPVVAQYRLGLDPRENLTQHADPEMGQKTVEVLVTASDVQLTVTSIEEGPAYIRFLDSNMQPFGTDVDEESDYRGADVDEESDYRGADVVGLDSQGRLTMNVMTSLTAAKALAYDQYQFTMPGIATENSYLDGLAGNYYQGSFRFFDPCPGNVRDEHFYVQVYEPTGKYLKTMEKITCIEPPGVNPSKLAVTTYADREGDATLSWTEAIGAVAHHVIAIDTRTFTVVQDSYQRVAAPVYSAEITGLEPAVEYIFAVAAERVDGSGVVSYSDPTSDDSHISQFMNWSRP